MFSQNKAIRFLDSIDSFSKEKQIQTILNLTYDEAVSDISLYETLTDSAISYSVSLKDSMLLANSYQKKVLALHFTSKNDEALQTSLKAVKIYESLNAQTQVGETYSNLGWKLKHRNFEKAFYYMQKGIKIREAKNNTSDDLFGSYDNFGVLHGMKKQWDSALYYHNKVLKHRRIIKDSISLPFSYAHIANVYLSTKRYHLAEQYLDSSLFIREKRKDIYGITDVNLYLGDLFFAKGEYKKAITNFKLAYNLSKKYKYYPLKKYATEYLYKSYDSIKNYEEALKYNLLFNKFKDSVSNVETNSRIAKLEIEFQTEKKEKEILTQRADLAEKELDINKKNYQIFGLGLFAFLLATLGYLLFKQQKLKNKQLQKENELKDALLKIETQNRLQEQRLRISRDLHDNIGAQLTFIISSLDNLKYGFKIEDKKLTNKLESISEFTSETIYELRDTIWAMNKNEITFEDLQSRISNFINKADLSLTDTIFIFNSEKRATDFMKFSSVDGMNIYRIIQEATNNAIKYAKASRIEVHVEKTSNILQIVIKDDGVGFDKSTVEFGNGINNIRKRASELDANMVLNSTPEKGTTVILSKSINM